MQCVNARLDSGAFLPEAKSLLARRRAGSQPNGHWSVLYPFLQSSGLTAGFLLGQRRLPEPHRQSIDAKELNSMLGF